MPVYREYGHRKECLDQQYIELEYQAKWMEKIKAIGLSEFDFAKFFPSFLKGFNNPGRIFFMYVVGLSIS